MLLWQETKSTAANQSADVIMTRNKKHNRKPICWCYYDKKQKAQPQTNLLMLLWQQTKSTAANQSADVIMTRNKKHSRKPICWWCYDKKQKAQPQTTSGKVPEKDQENQRTTATIAATTATRCLISFIVLQRPLSHVIWGGLGVGGRKVVRHVVENWEGGGGGH